jgi:hypothetical protein
MAHLSIVTFDTVAGEQNLEFQEAAGNTAVIELTYNSRIERCGAFYRLPRERILSAILPWLIGSRE